MFSENDGTGLRLSLFTNYHQTRQCERVWMFWPQTEAAAPNAELSHVTQSFKTAGMIWIFPVIQKGEPLEGRISALVPHQHWESAERRPYFPPSSIPLSGPCLSGRTVRLIRREVVNI